jgi:hypothetical protein
MRESHIGVPHRLHLGSSSFCDSGMNSDVRMATPVRRERDWLSVMERLMLLSGDSETIILI